MSNTRLCQCGSGLPPKDCCATNYSDVSATNNHKQIAYVGEAGRQREEFCREYTVYKQTAIAAIASNLRQKAEDAGKTISCHQGCTDCCYVYVVASLQECEAIVFYLYQNTDVLEHFLDAFPYWRAGVEHIRDDFFAISNIQQKRMSHADTPKDNKVFENALKKYAKQHLPCPFLKDDTCNIYEVRPYACAGLVSTTPAEWCGTNHQNHNKIKLWKAEVNLDSDPPYFANPESLVTLTNMPALVFEILSYGWDFLRRVPGCEHLTDPPSTT